MWYSLPNKTTWLPALLSANFAHMSENKVTISGNLSTSVVYAKTIILRSVVELWWILSLRGSVTTATIHLHFGE